jgi:hypothetical protein
MPFVQLRAGLGLVAGVVGTLALLFLVLIVAGRLISGQLYDIPLSALLGALA